VSKLGFCVGIAAVSAALVAAGCGGSGSNGSGETATTTEANERLTSAQWEEYQTSVAALKKANVTATATLKKCSDIAQAGDAAKLEACVGDDFSELATAADATYSTVEGFQSTVSGACADAQAALLNNLGTFRNSAAAMQTTIDTANLAAYPAASEDLQVTLTSGKSEAQTFEQDCAPV
jgi:hypothetical protein